jgi:hypothetical protein
MQLRLIAQPNRFITLILFLIASNTALSQWQFNHQTQASKGFDYDGLSVAQLNNGQYVLAGNIIDTIRLDDKNVLIPGTNPSCYVALMNSDHSVEWVQVIKHSSSSSRLAFNSPVQIANEKHIMVAGSFTGSFYFPNGKFGSAGSLADLFWVRYDLSGKLKAVGLYTDGILSTAIMNSQGQVALGGRTTVGGNNAFLARFDSSGVLSSNHNFVFQGTSNNRDIVNSLCFGPDNALYFAGKCNGDSIGYNGGHFVDGPNDMNRYNLFYGKVDGNMKLKWLKAATPMPGSRPYEFNLRQAAFQTASNRVLFSGKFEGANYKIGNDTLATTSTVNTDARKPILLCIDTAGNLQWHSSLGLKSENQRGDIFTLTPSPTGYWISADVEHYLFSKLNLGGVEFSWGGKAFVLLHLDSAGNITKGFGTDPAQKQKVNWINSCSFHPDYGLKLTMVNTIMDTLSLPALQVRKGSHVLFARQCKANASFIAFDDAICNNESALQIEALPKGGEFSGSGIDAQGWIHASQLKPGQFPFSYTVQDSMGCLQTLTDTFSILPVAAVSFAWIDSAFCPKDTVIILKANPSGGSFSGPGVQANKFNPSTAGIGKHQLSYLLPNANGCLSHDTISLRVKSPQECAPSGLLAKNSVQSMNIYPNPCSQHLHIQGSEPTELTFRVHDAQGRLLLQGQGKEIIDLANLPQGWLQISLSNGQNEQHFSLLHL